MLSASISGMGGGIKLCENLSSEHQPTIPSIVDSAIVGSREHRIE